MARIRKVAESEAGEVLAMWNENCVEAAGRGLSDGESAHVLQILRQYASHGNAFCLVAEEQGQLVGFVTACLLAHPVMESQCGEIEELYVQPHGRRRGIGSALVNQAVALLRQQGASSIRTHVCADSPLAKSFWQHLGWEHCLAVFSLCGE
jgi:ribosomal protein S18 acetylase RimI-like enzyme